jgi:hypothetical protein
MQIVHLFDNKDVVGDPNVFSARFPEVGLPLATQKTVEVHILKRNVKWQGN